MAENKTKPTVADPDAYILGIADPARREDASALMKMIRRVSGHEPVMWGAILGFGSYDYVYESGRTGTSFRTGFAVRARELVLYVMDGFPRHAELMTRLGRHRTGKSCLYIRRLSDIDLAVLEDLIAASLAHMDAAYPHGSTPS